MVLDPRVYDLPEGWLRRYAVWADGLTARALAWRPDAWARGLMWAVPVSALLWYAAWVDRVFFFAVYGPHLGLLLATLWTMGVYCGVGEGIKGMSQTGHKGPKSAPPCIGSGHKE